MNLRVITAILILAVGLASSSGAWASGLSGFENPPTRKASEVLPASLLSGAHFKVRDDVGWKEGLHLFTVDSDFGPFEVWGEPMLRVRLREVEALAMLKEISSSSVGIQSAKSQVTSSFRSMGQAFRHPVKTGKSVPGGVKRLFKSVKYDVGDVATAGKAVAEEKEQGGKMAAPDSAAAQHGRKIGRNLVGITSSYRKWSEKAGVNPYTTNEALKVELERLAKTEAGTKIGTKFFAPSLIPEELKVVTDVAKTAYHKDWRVIIEENDTALVQMGVDPAVSARFVDNSHFNLTLLTLVIELLEDMPGTADRNIVIEQASLILTDAEAVFFTESLMMAHWFYHHENPVARMLPGTLIPVAMTQDGRVIGFSASDFEYWTAKTAPIAAEFDTNYRALSRKREIWVADNVSPGFVRGVSNLGWSVRSDLRAKVLPEIPWGIQDEG